jgi:hypothetical protein
MAAPPVSRDSGCTKRGYLSERAAKRAHRGAHFRIRPYLCPRCHRWHVTNAEKGHRDHDL